MGSFKPNSSHTAIAYFLISVLAAIWLMNGTCLAQSAVPFEPSDTIEQIREKIRINGYNFKVKETPIFLLSDTEKRQFFNRRRSRLSTLANNLSRTSSIRPARRQSLPSSFDIRNLNGHSYIGEIRDQGELGSCYSFAATAAAEAAFNRHLGLFDADVRDFSESYLIWSLGSLAPYNSHFYGGDGADYDYFELKALTVPGASTGNEGVVDESLFPYQITQPSAEQITTSFTFPRKAFKAYSRVFPDAYEATTDEIKEAIYTYGAVDAAVLVTSAFDAYASGVYEDSANTADDEPYYYSASNHAISLVGWDDNPPEGGGGVWILRNSWGPSWGEDGYMRIRYFSAHVNTSATFLVYDPITPVIETSSISAKGERSATVAVDINPRGYNSSAHIEFGPTTDYGSLTEPFDAGASSAAIPVSLELSGLTPISTYHYRTVAENAFGTTFSADQVFTTMGPEHPPVILNLSSAERVANSALIGTLLQPLGGNTQYHFEYWDGSGQRKTTSPVEVSGSVVESLVSERIEELQPNTNYYYQAVASNYQGTTYSEEATFKTPIALLRSDFNDGVPAAGWSQSVVTQTGAVVPFWKQTDSTADFDAATFSAGDEARLVSTPLDLRGRTNVQISYRLKHDLLNALKDYLQIQVSRDGVTWNDLGEETYRYDGNRNSFDYHLVDLSSYEGVSKLYIGFLGHSEVGANIRIDNFAISSAAEEKYDTLLLSSSGSSCGVTNPLKGSTVQVLHGDAVSISATVPKQCSFLGWRTEGSVRIIDPSSAESRVSVWGDGSAIATFAPADQIPQESVRKQFDFDFKVSRKSRKAPYRVTFRSLMKSAAHWHYYWDFNGDGIIDSNQRTPTYTFPQKGRYVVSLTVRNGTRKSNPVRHAIRVGKAG